MTLAGPGKGADGEKQLVKLLGEYARRSSGTGFGFLTGGQEQRRRRLLALVCRVDTMEPARVAACAEAGADAVELNSAVTTAAALNELDGSLSVPWGIALRDASFDAWHEVLAQDGTSTAGWITLTMDDDARFLELKAVTKVLEVDLGVRPEILRGVAVSGADVVVAVGGDRETAGALTIADAMRLRLLCDVIKQPVLVSAALLAHDELGLRLAKDSGATGVLLEAADPDMVRALAGALEMTPEGAA